jgi:hypothetical protein
VPPSRARGNVAGPLRGQGSGRCVDVLTASQADGTQPARWDRNGAGHQTWSRS